MEIILVYLPIGSDLSDLTEEYVTPEILQILEQTKRFARKRYRSTIDNAKLTSLFAAEKGCESATISDGKNFDLGKDRILPLSKSS